MGAIATGIKLNADDRDAMRTLSRAVRVTPVVCVHGVWLNERAAELFAIEVDKLAVRYGLPEPEKDGDGDVIHYGISTDGEFTRWDGKD